MAVGSLTLETPRRRPRSLCFLSGVLRRSLKHATSPACVPTYFTSACPASYATLPAQLPIASLENLPDELLWPPSNPFCYSNSSVFHSQTTWKLSSLLKLIHVTGKVSNSWSSYIAPVISQLSEYIPASFLLLRAIQFEVTCAL